MDRTIAPDAVADPLLGFFMGYVMQRCVLDDVSPSRQLAGIHALAGAAND